MEAAQDELRLFTEVMKHVHQLKEENPAAVVNIVELQDHFLYTGVNGTHMCFVYERLGPSLLDLIKHYNYRGIPSAIVRPLVHDVSSFLPFYLDVGRTGFSPFVRHHSHGCEAGEYPTESASFRPSTHSDHHVRCHPAGDRVEQRGRISSCQVRGC